MVSKNINDSLKHQLLTPAERDCYRKELEEPSTRGNNIPASTFRGLGSPNSGRISAGTKTNVVPDAVVTTVSIAAVSDDSVVKNRLFPSTTSLASSSDTSPTKHLNLLDRTATGSTRASVTTVSTTEREQHLLTESLYNRISAESVFVDVGDNQQTHEYNNLSCPRLSVTEGEHCSLSLQSGTPRNNIDNSEAPLHNIIKNNTLLTGSDSKPAALQSPGQSATSSKRISSVRFQLDAKEQTIARISRSVEGRGESQVGTDISVTEDPPGTPAQFPSETSHSGTFTKNFVAPKPTSKPLPSVKSETTICTREESNSQYPSVSSIGEFSPGFVPSAQKNLHNYITNMKFPNPVDSALGPTSDSSNNFFDFSIF